MMRAVVIHIKGMVQGVSYRAQAKRRARELGLNGYVQNLRDGGVYLQVEGEAAAIDELIAWCKTGPNMARVLEVMVEDGPRKGWGYTSFEIH